MELHRTELIVGFVAGHKPVAPKQYSTVWLKKGQNRFTFHCFRCKNPIITIHGDVFEIAPGRVSSDSGEDLTDKDMRVNCDNYVEDYGPCPARYIFAYAEDSK